MGAHAAGTGSTWQESSPDVGQPHGLDYRELQDIRRGVRKRISKEHETFADATLGGEHIPGGCAVLGIDEATADMTAKAADATGYIGRGLIYDQANNALWCWTNADGTTSANPYRLVWGPSCISQGGDFTWSGNHHFDNSTDFSAVEITGPALLDDSADIKGALNCWSKAEFTGGALFDDSVDIKGALNCWSSAEFTGGVIFDDSVAITGALVCASNVNITGDFSGNGTAHDRIASAWAKVEPPSTILDGYNIGHADVSSTGIMCISFINNMSDTNYAMFACSNDSSTGHCSIASCYSALVSGFRVKFIELAGNPRDPSRYSVIVWGG